MQGRPVTVDRHKVCISLSPVLKTKLEDFQKSGNFISRSEALRHMIEAFDVEKENLQR